MNNEENIRKAWQAPEVRDLDMDKTEGGASFVTAESISFNCVS